MSAFLKAIKISGGVTALANKLGVSQPMVSQWKVRGVPIGWVIAIEKAVGKRVTREQLAPTIYRK